MVKRIALFVGVFVLGGICGTLLDHIHVVTDTLSYKDPTWQDQPWWVVPQFGLAVLGLIGICLGLMRWLKPGKSNVGALITIIDALAFVVVYWLSAYVNAYAETFLAVGVGVWLISISLRKDRIYYLVVGSLAAVAGPGYEMALSSTDAFTYAKAAQDVVGVPMWLPVLYLFAATLLANLAILIKRGPLNSKIPDAVHRMDT